MISNNEVNRRNVFTGKNALFLKSNNSILKREGYNYQHNIVIRCVTRNFSGQGRFLKIRSLRWKNNLQHTRERPLIEKFQRFFFLDTFMMNIAWPLFSKTRKLFTSENTTGETSTLRQLVSFYSESQENKYTSSPPFSEIFFFSS